MGKEEQLGHGLTTMKRIFNWMPSFEEASKLEIPAVCANEVLGPPKRSRRTNVGRMTREERDQR